IWIDETTGRMIRRESTPGFVFQQIDQNKATWLKRIEKDNGAFACKTLNLTPSQLHEDFRKLNSMKVKTGFKPLGGPVTVESLNVPGQRFTGTTEREWISGTFETTLDRYMGDAALPFPVPDLTQNDSLKSYLIPEDQIEVDHLEIKAKADELTRGARHSWDAATRMSAWVGDKVSFESYDGSALETLNTLKGESRAQSRLLTALCRAVNIPARVVTGLLYTHYYDGFFSEHHWVEIYMGEAGWIPVDTAAWEIDYIDVGHIRLGEDVSFSCMEIDSCEFSNAETSEIETAPSKDFHPVTWKPDRAAAFRYAFKGKELGTAAYQIERAETSDRDTVYECTTELNFKDQQLKGSWKLTAAGRPLHYQVGGKAGRNDYQVDCVFSEDRVEMKIQQADRFFEETVSLEGAVYLVDNNCLSLYEFLVSGLTLTQGARFAFNVFYPSAVEVLPLKIEVERREQVLWHQEQISCWVLALDLDGAPLRLWVDQDGRIINETEQHGRLMVERLPEQTD
ncbi:MAG: transglutaminase-like domain-containing protein, partial [Planctomycetes bacterium]|nr:transglutaminase-like domain-containing protein [Planctomycetota bacterium]